jgi:hypothetical protein
VSPLNSDLIYLKGQNEKVSPLKAKVLVDKKLASDYKERVLSHKFKFGFDKRGGVN